MFAFQVRKMEAREQRNVGALFLGMRLGIPLYRASKFFRCGKRVLKAVSEGEREREKEFSSQVMLRRMIQVLLSGSMNKIKGKWQYKQSFLSLTLLGITILKKHTKMMFIAQSMERE